MSTVRPRVRESDSLAHDCRAFVFDQIQLEPGINLSALEDRTSVSLSTLRYHLRVLERAEVVRSEKQRGRRRLYPATFDADELERAIRDGPDELLDALESLTAPSGLELSSALGLDPSTISHHLTRLEDAGVISRSRDGKTVVNELTPAAREAMAAARDPVSSRPVRSTA